MHNGRKSIIRGIGNFRLPLIFAGIANKVTAIIMLASVFTSDVAYQLKAAEYVQGFSLEAILISVIL